MPDVEMVRFFDLTGGRGVLRNDIDLNGISSLFRTSPRPNPRREEKTWVSIFTCDPGSLAAAPIAPPAVVFRLSLRVAVLQRWPASWPDCVNFKLRIAVPGRLVVPDFNLLGTETMKRLLLASAAVVAMSAPSFAADLAARPYTKAPPPIVSPATNWSGFYIGAMGGYASSDQIRGSIPGLGGGSLNTGELDGGFGGGTIGYNWQAPGSQFVWGLEVDAAGASIGYSQTVLNVTGRDRIDALGSVTGRLGVAFDSALLYFKGGYAWADNEISVDVAGVNVYRESKVHSGWTIGGGFEWMFAPAWSAKAEYMYADFDKERYGAAILPPGADLGASVHTFKVGVNYHFGWGGAAGTRY